MEKRFDPFDGRKEYILEDDEKNGLWRYAQYDARHDGRIIAYGHGRRNAESSRNGRNVQKITKRF